MMFKWLRLSICHRRFWTSLISGWWTWLDTMTQLQVNWISRKSSGNGPSTCGAWVSSYLRRSLASRSGCPTRVALWRAQTPQLIYTQVLSLFKEEYLLRSPSCNKKLHKTYPNFGTERCSTTIWHSEIFSAIRNSLIFCNVASTWSRRWDTRQTDFSIIRFCNPID